MRLSRKRSCLISPGRKGVFGPRAGFTLMEVLVALAILGIAGTLIFRLLSVNLRNLAMSEDYVWATARAEAELTRVLDEEKIEEGRWTRVIEGGHTIEIAVSETLRERTEPLGTRILQVNLVLRWTRNLAEKSIHLCTYRLVRKER